MSRRHFAVAAIVAMATAPASADQYVIRAQKALPAASAGLQQSLKIRTVDTFSHDGAHYVVIESPDEAYLEAYFFALESHPDALYRIDAGWSAQGLSGLSLDQRMPFLAPAPCDFCAR